MPFHTGSNLHDFDITIQPSYPSMWSYPTAGPLCATYSGAVPAGSTEVV